MDKQFSTRHERRGARLCSALCLAIATVASGCRPWSTAQVDPAVAQLKADNSSAGDLTAQLNSSKPGERRAALEQLADPQAGPLPENISRFASDSDRNVRRAAITTIAARRHPDAIELLHHALGDSDSGVRLAAIAGFGMIGSPEALAELRRLTTASSDSTRAAAYRALIERNDPDALAGAASDKASDVRRLAAAEFVNSDPGPREAALAEKLVAERNLDVAKQTIESVSHWPLSAAGPVLLTAMQGLAYQPRKLAAERLAARWPPATRFEVDASADRRAKLLTELREKWRVEFPATAIVRADSRTNVAATDSTEPGERSLAAVEQLTSPNVRERRRAADVLRDAYIDKRLPVEALERLVELMTRERDELVLISVFELLASDVREPAISFAYVALSHPAPEVRRRACEHLAAHPDHRHAAALTASLSDPSPAVVEAAVNALGRIGAIDDPQPLERLLAHEDHLLRVEVAAALARAGVESGTSALERLVLDPDPKVRQAAARAMGQAPHEAATGR